jgi:hypothetical protein
MRVFRSRCEIKALWMLLFILAAVPAFSQVSFSHDSLDAIEPGSAIERFDILSPPTLAMHSFCDRENRILFTAVAASSTADFALTYSNLRNGGKELNPITRLFSGSTAGLAFNFAGETAGVIGVSYFLHKTGHHKLERVVAVINTAASTAAVTYDVKHR